MKAYLKYMPILCVVISFGVFVSSVMGYENHLKTGKTMYVRLAPVDPRSILQGDYMELRYELHLEDVPKEIDWMEEDLAENDWAENGLAEEGLTENGLDNELIEGEAGNAQADIEASEIEHEAQEINEQETGGIEADNRGIDNQEINSTEADNIEAKILKHRTAQEAFDQWWEAYQNKRRITAYAELNEHDELIATHLEPIDGANVHQLQLKNPYGYWQNLHPAAKSFMFAEGLAQCYEQAKFAKLSVAEDGKAMLVDLVGEDLNSLDCESQSSWTSPL